MATKRKIIDSIKVLVNSVSFGGPKTDEAMLLVATLWLRAFEDHSDDDLDYMVYAHLDDPKECKSFPQPGLLKARLFERDNGQALALWHELVRDCANLRPMAKRLGPPAWGRVCRAMRDAGFDQSDLPRLGQQDYGNAKRDAFCTAWRAGTDAPIGGPR